VASGVAVVARDEELDELVRQGNGRGLPAEVDEGPAEGLEVVMVRFIPSHAMTLCAAR
jgi:hypothetical protein